MYNFIKTFCFLSVIAFFSCAFNFKKENNNGQRECPPNTFSKEFRIPGYNTIPISIDEDSKGNLIVTGKLMPKDYTEKLIEGLPDVPAMFMYKFNSKGDSIVMKHTQAYDGVDVEECSDGGYMFVGSMNENGSVYVCKTNEKLEIVWEKIISAPYSSRPAVIRKTSKGEFVILAGIGNPVMDMGNKFGIRIIKVSESGNILEDKKIVSKYENAIADDIQELPDGGFILSGTLTVGQIKLQHSELMFPKAEFYLLKLDNEFNKVWEKGLAWKRLMMNDINWPDSTDSHLGGTIQVLKDGSFVMNGLNVFSGSYKQRLVKFNSNGDEVWTFNFVGEGDHSNVAIGAEGNIVVSGEPSMFGRKSSLMMVSPQGVDLYRKVYDYPVIFTAKMKATCDKGFVIVALGGPIGKEVSIRLIKVDRYGDIKK